MPHLGQFFCLLHHKPYQPDSQKQQLSLEVQIEAADPHGISDAASAIEKRKWKTRIRHLPTMDGRQKTIAEEMALHGLRLINPERNEDG